MTVDSDTGLVAVELVTSDSEQEVNVVIVCLANTVWEEACKKCVHVGAEIHNYNVIHCSFTEKWEVLAPCFLLHVPYSESTGSHMQRVIYHNFVWLYGFNLYHIATYVILSTSERH